MKQYDIAVIGAGSGGLVAALNANRRGARVALIENNKIGGECTHAGCVPSKSLISSARLYYAMQHGEPYGLPKIDPSPSLDFASVMEHVNDIVQGVYQNEQPEHFQELGIDVYIDPSGARFLNPHEIQIGDVIIWAESSIIATGSSPRMAPHEGGELVQALNNENFWAIRKLPRSIVFLGGGVISVEIGQSLARFGSDVTIIDRNPRILKVVDEEVAVLATEALQREGIHIITESEVTTCRQLANGKVQLSILQKEIQREMITEQIFVALGRTPNITGLGLENAGVEFTDSGIKTNVYLQTTTPNIYACGDVTSPAKFTHMASFQADICLNNIFNGSHIENDLSLVPWAIFMEPEIGHVGMTETQALKNFAKVNVSKVGTNSVDRFITERNTEGFLKIIMDENDVVLGADAIGAHAGEWIQFFTLVIRQKLPIQSLGELIFIYPTFSEIVKKGITRYLRNK